MIKLFLDIETLPGPDSLKKEIAETIKPPGTMAKEDTIRRWEEETKPQKVEEEYRNTAMKGHYGRVLCIGYIKETDEGLHEDIITGDEPEILRKFWNVAKDVDLFIGFNIFNFDLKFIIQRSIIDRVKPSKDLSFARYRSDPIYDVKDEWVKWDTRDYIALDTLAKALDLPSPKSQMTGAEVYDYFRQGKLAEIYDYCMVDVKATREIYRRMNFIT